MLAIGLVPVRFGYIFATYGWLRADAIWTSFPVTSAINLALAIGFLLHGGWKKARMSVGERRTTTNACEEALATREPGGALNPAGLIVIASAANRFGAIAARIMSASFPSLRMRRGRVAPVDARDARRAPPSPERLHLAAVHLRRPRLRGADRARFQASAAGASTASARRRKLAAEPRHPVHRPVPQHAREPAHR